ncbi:MAG: bifunctional UDP-N-acetylglucosamine diphosphorylase/glucosamine-1-phosphate N-acetyltransferase GlmU [Rhodobacteraceae bacterium]|nr:bifunctional UDP-N-acetylglucosamine diphosphorylase/glucosamine-1-phosphate N-acetyltransferase GlmU [Paracoccaceae bacterium]
MALAAVILAAGSGERMGSNTPKVLHEIAGAPMLLHVARTAEALAPERLITVTGPASDEVRKQVRAFGIQTDFALQTEQRGTAHAVAAAREGLRGFEGRIVILYGDTPLLTAESLHKLTSCLDAGADIAVLGFKASDPTGYGRLIFNGDGEIETIVEHRDADAEQRRIIHCNSGVMAADAGLLFELIDKVKPDNEAAEYYLTDIVTIARAMGLRTGAAICDESETRGVNDRVELASAEAAFQDRARKNAMRSGVTLIAPDSVHFSHDTELGPDTVVEPFVRFGPGVRIGGGVRIMSFTYLQGCDIGSHTQIGPFARLRPGTELGTGVRVGNFVEIKKAHLADGSRAAHLSYIGDASIGKNANIGAGTIFCNFDGRSKHHSVVGDQAFIGSDTVIVSPVHIGDAAMTAAGSVITRDVPADSLGIARSRQSVIKDFARRFRDRWKRPVSDKSGSS